MQNFKLNTEKNVAVSTDVYLSKNMSAAPRGCKLQLLGAGGVLVYGQYKGEDFWVAWAPLPKKPEGL